MNAKKIALIEDDKILSKVLNTALGEAGFTVSQAFDGEAGLELIRSVHPDLILLDLMLPKKQGSEVLNELKKSHDTKNIPVIILTILENPVTIADALEGGAYEYIVKSNFRAEDIVKKVQEHFTRSITP